MIDMSAAFDVVDTELLLNKLKLYGFDKHSVQWIWSYLTHRSQAVYIEGSLSSLLPLEDGVPQGSILGPYSPMSCLRLSMNPTVLSGMWRRLPSSPSSARSVVVSAVMLMTAPIQPQGVIQLSYLQSLQTSTMFWLTYSQLISLR